MIYRFLLQKLNHCSSCGDYCQLRKSQYSIFINSIVSAQEQDACYLRLLLRVKSIYSIYSPHPPRLGGSGPVAYQKFCAIALYHSFSFALPSQMRHSYWTCLFKSLICLRFMLTNATQQKRWLELRLAYSLQNVVNWALNICDESLRTCYPTPIKWWVCFWQQASLSTSSATFVRNYIGTLRCSTSLKLYGLGLNILGGKRKCSKHTKPSQTLAKWATGFILN